jgi:DNA-binding transcriptional MerR regulator
LARETAGRKMTSILSSNAINYSDKSKVGTSREKPPKLYRIGEVVDYSGVSRQTIHNYTTMGLLRESRWTPGGHRLYDESVFERLDKINEFKASNKSLQDIREYFASLEKNSAVETHQEEVGQAGTVVLEDKGKP